MKKLFNKIYTKLSSNKKLQELYSYFPKKELTEKEWRGNGKPVPPPHIVKEKVVSDYQKTSQYKILVETGTFLGEMVNAQINNFEKIYSIELDEKLYNRAKRKFRKYPDVKILNGDSGKVLMEIIPILDSNTVFWLDGHYSGGITARGEKDSPIFEELKIILETKKNHIILIDDARLFTGDGDYPTIKRLTDFILSYKKESEIRIEDDITRIVLK